MEVHCDYDEEYNGKLAHLVVGVHFTSDPPMQAVKLCLQIREI